MDDLPDEMTGSSEYLQSFIPIAWAEKTFLQKIDMRSKELPRYVRAVASNAANRFQ